MYKTVQITCFTKPFYVSAFGFVGCILIVLELRCSFFDINIFGILSAFLSIRGLLRNTVLFYTEASGTQVGVDYFILSDNVQS